MDEFFDFERATSSQGRTATGESDFPSFVDDMDLDQIPAFSSNDAFENFDLNLALAEAGRDEDAFLCMAHFTKDAPDHQISFDLHNSRPIQRSRSAADEIGFPSWIDDRDVRRPTCEYCTEKGFHCKTITAGDSLRRGDCTSCVALDRECSFNINRSPGDGDDEGSPSLENQQASSKSPTDGAYRVNIETAHSSASDFQALGSMKEDRSDADVQQKTGTRFSRDSLRILRAWLTAHHRLPYPSDEDKESLQKQTGLSKTQISNWIANARRRGKVRAPRTISPGPNRLKSPIDISRHGVPTPRDVEEMNPLQRWENSPPEHEAASVVAIANAISSAGLAGDGSPLLDYRTGDSDSIAGGSCHRSSTSGFGTSGSSGDSFASAFSQDSRNSFGSLAARVRRRRGQRREVPKPILKGIPTLEPPRKFQCTFCTETFKTKHDWQRHEKALHLSLERWICALNGPIVPGQGSSAPLCAFCGATNPDEAHSEHHNYELCSQRTLEERTFYRKDHLRQHLLLVHDSKSSSWPMEAWRVETTPVKSRCGFCDSQMDTWATRVDHLARHFKSGKDMSDWKGDWGFEPQILALVENVIPPYLIHFERNTPQPYKASKEDSRFVRQPYDLVKTGLVDFINEKVTSGGTPTDNELLNVARQIYKRLDLVAAGRRYQGFSWLRDLFMTGTEYLGLKSSEPSNLPSNLSDPERSFGRCCPNEASLGSFVGARMAIGAPPTTHELQIEACRILAEAESISTFPCDSALGWFSHMITSSSDWLEDFRRRQGLPSESEQNKANVSLTTGLEYDNSSDVLLQKELTDYVDLCSKMGLSQPSDSDLQAQARIVIFGIDDPQYKTVADNQDWLRQFKRRYDHFSHATEALRQDSIAGGFSEQILSSSSLSSANAANVPPHLEDPNETLHWDISSSPARRSTPAFDSTTANRNVFNPMTNNPAPFSRFALPLYPQDLSLEPSKNDLMTKPLTPDPNATDSPRRYFFSDANCYRRLVYELSRFVASCRSPNNPNPHIPSDEEIQRQSRWIIYDDDDPWNQTAADNEEWLMRFKRDLGIIAADSNTGLGLSYLQPSVTPSAG